jgi:hypothetical protein
VSTPVFSRISPHEDGLCQGSFNFPSSEQYIKTSYSSDENIPHHDNSIHFFIMRFTVTLALLALLSSIQGAPTLPKRQDGGNPPLRGSEDLLGYSPGNKLTGQTTEIKYTLAPGQKENEDIGLYLDFTDIENPQPIRGSKGGSDPGPRMPRLFFSIFIYEMCVLICLYRQLCPRSPEQR